MKENIYYHYCSIETFVSIISTSTLRFGNPLYMNDSAEVVWLIQLLKDVVKDQDELRTIAEKWGMIEPMARDIINSLHNGIPYIACLSKNGDVLSQWRAYADDGRGVAIGFNPNLMKDEFTQESVEYDVNKQKNIINEKIDPKHFGQLKLAIESKQISEIYNKTQIILSHIINDALICKNPAFKEEQEYRLILRNKHDEKFRVSNNRIIPYKVLDFSKQKRFIDHIVVGPKCDAYDANMALFIKKMGYPWSSEEIWNPNDEGWAKHIKISKATYR